MVMRKAARKPEQLDALELFRILDRRAGTTPVADEARIEAVIDQLRTGLRAALGRASTVHGWRAQAHFAGLVVALDACELLVTLDSGEVFMDGGDIKLPDYLLVTKAGEKLLVEVKNIPPGRGLGQVVLSAGEMAALRRYEALAGGELHIAVLFSALHQWALVPCDAFRLDAGTSKYVISGEDALKVSTLGNQLGDFILGVEPPLAVTVTPDAGEPITLEPDGTWTFTVGSVALSAGGRAPLQGDASRLALRLYLYGAWADEMHADTNPDGTLRALVFTASPDSPTPGQGFEIVTTLSALYQRWMDGVTRSGATIYGLQVPTTPGMLTALLPVGLSDPDLPLWQFRLSPG
ncbi:MAG: hypothetical protein JWM02_1309 [Frankiales bacterium]|nr:hypothetical protein [Frankiales bacterium]